MPHWDKEKVIKEKRTMEATKKNLMGSSGKLGFICKTLGSPITRQGSAYINSSFLEDPYDMDHYEAEYEQCMDEDNLGPMVDPGRILDYDGDFVYDEGIVFDGLHWGMHLEIINNYAEKKITATYKGFAVYEEIAGDLVRYAPFPEWEQLIDRLYKTAKERAKKDGPLKLAELELKVADRKATFFQRLRERWGI